MIVVAEGERTAYRCQVIAEQLSAMFAPRVRSECATVDDALRRLACGEVVVVAGSDMHALRTRLAGLGIG